MFNLPYIAYGVFALVTVAGIFLGVKKGFRYALYFFVVVLISIGISAGISQGVYPYVKKPIAAMLRKYFDGAAGYSYERLVDATRPQALALLISLFTVVVFPLVFLATWFLRRIAEKFDAPRVVRIISENSKQVIFKNPVVNKTLSVSITTISSLGTASVIAAALSPIVTKPKDTNFFYQAVGKISRAMTFGEGYSSDRMQDLYSIIPLTNDASLMRGFDFFFAPGNTMAQNDIAAFNASANKPTLIKLLESNDIAAIGSFITSAGSIKKLYPIGTDASGKDEMDAQQIKTTLAQYNLHLSQEAIDEVTDFIKKNSIESFEDSWAAKQLENAKKTLKDMQSELEKKTEALQAMIENENHLLKNVALKINDRAEIINNVKRTITLNNDLVNQIKQQAPVTENAKQASGLADTKYSTEQSKLSQLQSEFSTANAALTNAKQAYQTALSKLTEAQKAQSQLPSLNAALQNATNDESKAQTDYNNASGDATTKNDISTQAEGAWLTASQDRVAAQTAYDNNPTAQTKAALDAAVSAEKDALKEKDIAAQNASAAVIASGDAYNKLSSAQARKASADSALRTATNLANQIGSLQSASDAAYNEQEAKTKDFNTADNKVKTQQPITDAAFKDKQAANAKYKTEQQKLDDLKTKQSDAYSHLYTSSGGGVFKNQLVQNESEINSLLREIGEIQYAPQTRVISDLTYSQSSDNNSNNDVTFGAPTDTQTTVSVNTSTFDYKKSRWYLSSSNPNNDPNLAGPQPAGTPINPTYVDVTANGNTHEQATPYLTKDYKAIQAGTEGYIQVLNFNMDQFKTHINDLDKIKAAMEKVYNQNWDTLKKVYEETT